MAEELLDSWRERVLPELQRLGALDFRVAEDGSTATLELKRDSVVTSITAWSTGMLEFASSATEVVTEQRHARSAAHALLDDWLAQLNRQ
jgi:hypothetical protein